MTKNFRWVDNNLAGCAMPIVENDIDDIKSRGVDSIVSLVGDVCGLDSKIASVGLRHKRILIPDNNAPRVEQIDEFLNFVKAEKASGHKTIVHCVSGFGRTNTMVGIYLLDSGLPFNQVLSKIGFVETPEQMNSLINFALSKSADGLKDSLERELRAVSNSKVRRFSPEDIVKN